ncbi:MAG: class I SAM-dependent methyltransferase [Planctomycetota bacterium]
MVRKRLSFLKEFLTHPQEVGALAPSSRRLAEAMIDGFDLARAQTVVEIGPGSGAFTQRILERAGPETRVVAVELNAAFVDSLRAKFAHLDVFHGSAEQLRAVLDARAGDGGGDPRADFIVSGLPWAAFEPALQQRLLDAVVASLKDGGGFSTFAYIGAAWLPRARRFRRLLECHFSTVETSPVVWGNLPPAFAYRCRNSPG